MTRRNFPPCWLGTAVVEEADGKARRVGELGRLYIPFCGVELGVLHVNIHHAPSD